MDKEQILKARDRVVQELEVFLKKKGIDYKKDIPYSFFASESSKCITFDIKKNAYIFDTIKFQKSMMEYIFGADIYDKKLSYNEFADLTAFYEAFILYNNEEISFGWKKFSYDDIKLCEIESEIVQMVNGSPKKYINQSKQIELKIRAMTDITDVDKLTLKQVNFIAKAIDKRLNEPILSKNL